MMQVNIADTATKLPELVRLIETGQAQQVALLREGKPVAELNQYHRETETIGDGRHVRIGIAEGKLIYPDDIHAFDDETVEMFGV